VIIFKNERQIRGKQGHHIHPMLPSGPTIHPIQSINHNFHLEHFPWLESYHASNYQSYPMMPFWLSSLICVSEPFHASSGQFPWIKLFDAIMGGQMLLVAIQS